MKHARKIKAPIALVVCLAMASMWLLGPTATGAPASKAATSATNFTNVAVAGTFGSSGTFRGTMDITKFAVSDGKVVAVGTMTGTAKNSAGSVVKRIVDVTVQIPITAPSSTCKILHLELGPLDLNLLGLVIHLNRVVLDITAHSGPGQLLGNLLCALAHLLDGSVPPTVVSNLLTAVVRIVTALHLLN